MGLHMDYPLPINNAHRKSTLESATQAGTSQLNILNMMIRGGL